MPLVTDIMAGIAVLGPTLDSPTTLFASFLQWVQEKVEGNVIDDIYSLATGAIVSSNQTIYVGPSSVIGWNNAMYCFYQVNSTVYYASCTVGYISADQQIPNVSMYQSPGAVMYEGQPYIFFNNTSNQLAYTTLSSTGWSANTVIIPATYSTTNGPISIAQTPAVVTFNGSAYVFYPDLSNSGQITYWAYNGTTWTSGTIPGASSSQMPSALVFNNTLYLAYQSSALSGQISLCSTADGTTWNTPVALPVNPTSASPSLAIFNDQVYLFYQGFGSNAGLLYYNVWNGSTWSATAQVANMGVTMTGAPSAVASGTKLYVVYQAGGSSSGQLYYSAFSGTSWAAGYHVPNTPTPIVGSPWVFINPSNTLVWVFYGSTQWGGYVLMQQQLLQNNGGSILHQFSSFGAQAAGSVLGGQNYLFAFGQTAAGTWQLYYWDVSAVGGVITAVPNMTPTLVPVIQAATTSTTTTSAAHALSMGGSPSPVVYNSQLYAFYQGSGASPALCGAQYNNQYSTWSTLSSLPSVTIAGSPSATVYGGQLYVFYLTSSTTGQLAYTSYNGTSWIASTPVPNVAISAPPSVATLNNVLYVVFQGSGSNAGSLYYCTYSNKTWSSPQQVSGASLSGAPLAVTYNGVLYVLYEGSTAGQFWYVAFDGTDWAQAMQISNVTIWGTPSALVNTPSGQSPGTLYIAHREMPASGQTSSPGNLYYCTGVAGGLWTNQQLGSTTGGASNAPSAVVFQGVPYVFYANLTTPGPVVFTYYTTTTPPGGSASSRWDSVTVPNAVTTGSPTPVLYDNDVYVFYSNNGQLWYSVGSVTTNPPASYTVPPASGTWSNPIQVLPPNASNPGVALMNGEAGVVLFNNVIYAFYQASANPGQLWYTTFNGSWSNESQILANTVYISGSPLAFVYNGQMYLVYQGNGNYYYLTSSTGSSWNGPTQFGPMLLAPSPSVVAFNDQILCFTQGSGADGQLWCAKTPGSNTWSLNMVVAGDVNGATIMSASPSAVVVNGTVYAFYQTGGGGMLAYTYGNGSSWTSNVLYYSQTAPGTTYMSNSPSAVLFNGKTYVFYQGNGANGQLWYSVFNGSTCTTVTTQVPNVSMSQSPAAVVFNNTLYVFYQGGGDNQTLQYCCSTDGNTWTNGSSTNNLSGSDYTPCISPSAVVFNNTIYIFFSLGGTKDDAVGFFAYCTFDGSNWSSLSMPTPANPIGDSYANMSGSPSAVVLNNQLYVFFASIPPGGIGPKYQNNCYLWYTVSSNGNNWSAITQSGPASLSNSPGGAALAGALTETESALIGTNAIPNPFLLDF